MPPPEAEDFNNNSLVVSNLIYTGYMSNIQALSILFTTSSFQKEEISVLTLQLS
ncbi:hypothetical protein BJX76DRAFT_339118 [Aspergillus varians]